MLEWRYQGIAKLITELIHDFTLKCVSDDHALQMTMHSTLDMLINVFVTMTSLRPLNLLSLMLLSIPTFHQSCIPIFRWHIQTSLGLHICLERSYWCNNLVTYDIHEAWKSFKALKLILSWGKCGWPWQWFFQVPKNYGQWVLPPLQCAVYIFLQSECNQQSKFQFPNFCTAWTLWASTCLHWKSSAMLSIRPIMFGSCVKWCWLPIDKRLDIVIWL